MINMALPFAASDVSKSFPLASYSFPSLTVRRYCSLSTELKYLTSIKPSLRMYPLSIGLSLNPFSETRLLSTSGTVIPFLSLASSICRITLVSCSSACSKSLLPSTALRASLSHSDIISEYLRAFFMSFMFLVEVSFNLPRASWRSVVPSATITAVWIPSLPNAATSIFFRVFASLILSASLTVLSLLAVSRLFFRRSRFSLQV